jgi:putative proteasome-type protease
MSYCLAIKVNDGLVFASDSRTNAGVDYVSVYSKMHTFRLIEGRILVLLSAGNLATSQAVVNALRRDLADPDAPVNLNTVHFPFDAAHYIGEISLRVQSEHPEVMNKSGVNVEASFILGGQIGLGEHEIYLIYPQGNYISTSEETPYLQIGESKYGKPILDRLAHPAMSLADGARLALVSLDATAKSNATVGMPFDVTLYRNDCFDVAASQRFGRDSIVYQALNETWNQALEQTFESLATTLPTADWHLS